MTNQDGFYRLWQAVSGLSGLDNFPIDRLDEEDFVLAEAMVGEGLNRLMEFKTQLLNAKMKKSFVFDEIPFDQKANESMFDANGEIKSSPLIHAEFIQNADTELQTPDLQRGVLPQTEEGKEGVFAETDTDKETLSALFRSKELNGRNYPHLNREGESFITKSCIRSPKSL